MHTQQQEGTYSAMVVVPAGIVVEQDSRSVTGVTVAHTV